MIGRIRTRASFARLRRDGRRTRVDLFWCTHLIDPTSDTTRVAFAISRSVGTAVTRNRLRRRLRSMLPDLGLPAGLYLIGCRPGAGELTFGQVRTTMIELARKIERQRHVVRPSGTIPPIR